MKRYTDSDLNGSEGRDGCARPEWSEPGTGSAAAELTKGVFAPARDALISVQYALMDATRHYPHGVRNACYRSGRRLTWSERPNGRTVARGHGIRTAHRRNEA